MTAGDKLLAPKRRTRVEVQKLVAEFVNGDMRRSEFCRTRGLSLGTLNRHLKKQSRKRKSRRASSPGRTDNSDGQLVPVELASKKSVSDHASNCPLVVVLSGGRRIEVHYDFDVQTLNRLVYVLERA
jgi:hypothetical protein